MASKAWIVGYVGQLRPVQTQHHYRVVSWACAVVNIEPNLDCFIEPLRQHLGRNRFGGFHFDDHRRYESLQ